MSGHAAIIGNSHASSSTASTTRFPFDDCLTEQAWLKLGPPKQVFITCSFLSMLIDERHYQWRIPLSQ